MDPDSKLGEAARATRLDTAASGDLFVVNNGEGRNAFRYLCELAHIPDAFNIAGEMTRNWDVPSVSDELEVPLCYSALPVQGSGRKADEVGNSEDGGSEPGVSDELEDQDG
jgi:hypothetical protein